MAIRSTKSNKPIDDQRWRINAVLLMAVLAIGGGACSWATYRSSSTNSLSKPARRDQSACDDPAAPRRIRDSTGNVLALDVDRESLYVKPQLIDSEKRAATGADALGPARPCRRRNPASLQDQEQYARIARWLEPEIAEQITDSRRGARAGAGAEPRAVYPQGSWPRIRSARSTSRASASAASRATTTTS